MKLSCQEHLLPGDGILEKWEFARGAGFDGIELRGTGDWNGRLDEFREARERGAVFSSVCLISDRFIGDFDPEIRREATDHMKDLLSGIAELGGMGAVTPARRPSWIISTLRHPKQQTTSSISGHRPEASALGVKKCVTV